MTLGCTYDYSADGPIINRDVLLSTYGGVLGDTVTVTVTYASGEVCTRKVILDGSGNATIKTTPTTRGDVTASFTPTPTVTASATFTVT